MRLPRKLKKKLKKQKLKNWNYGVMIWEGSNITLTKSQIKNNYYNGIGRNEPDR